MIQAPLALAKRILQTKKVIEILKSKSVKTRKEKMNKKKTRMTKARRISLNKSILTQSCKIVLALHQVNTYVKFQNSQTNQS